jgi:hypothetical protein
MKMPFVNFFQAAIKGIVHQIPYVGPIIQAIEGSVKDARLHAALARLAILIEQQKPLAAAGITQEQFKADLDLLGNSKNHTIASTLLLAEAETSLHLAEPSGSKPGNRFLYLATSSYASSRRTAEIATEYGFLWRSYHRAKARVEANNRVNLIGAGDLIVLGYRLKKEGKSHFRVLLPLIVQAEGTMTHKIVEGDDPCHNHIPFVLANPELSRVLEAEEYKADVVLGGQCGLNVQALRFDPSADANADILSRVFRSPGKDAIWQHDEELSPELTAWIAGL